MTPLEKYFDRIFVINLDRQTSKWKDCKDQLDKFGITKYERFSGFDLCGPIDDGNRGCTESHHAIQMMISHYKWKRTLILEDDFKIRFDDFHEKFNAMISEVPDDWEMLYLGGHYGEAPQYRVSKHVIRPNYMMSTAAYGITYELARELAPFYGGAAGADALYYNTHRTRRCYVLQPRLISCRPCFSDIQNRDTDNSGSMEDTNHENMV